MSTESTATKIITQVKPAVFSSKFRVYYEDTDAGGIVYHANYLKFCERTRTDFVREILGYEQQRHLQEEKQGFVLCRMRANFISSAKLEDLLTITCVPFHIQHARLEMYQEIMNEQDQVIFAMSSMLAFVDFLSGKPKPMPAEFKDKVVAWVSPEVPKMRC